MKKFTVFSIVIILIWLTSCTTAKNVVVEDPRIGTLQKQVTDLQTEIIDLKNLLAVRDLSISDLNGANLQLQATANTVNAIQEKLAMMQTQLTDKSAIIDKLSAGDPKLQALLDTNTLLQSKLTDVSKQLTIANTAIKDLTVRIQAGDAKLVLMASNFDQTAKRIGSLEAVISNLKSQLVDRDAAIVLLQAHISSVLKDTTELIAKLKVLQSGTTLSEASYLEKINMLNQAAILAQQKIGNLEDQVAALTLLSQRDAKDLDARVAILSKLFAKEIAAGDLEVKRFRNVLVIDIKDSVLFPPDQAILLPKSKELLLILADAFKQVPERLIRVEGNTAVAISSPEALRLYPTSWHLGAARAVTVVQFMQEKAGMDPHQLVATSQGEYNPIAENSTEVGKAQNRRVEFVIVPKELWMMEKLVNMINK